MNRFITPLIFLLVTVACGGDDEPAPPVEQSVSRTVLVYMVADNTLGNAGLDVNDMKEMIASSADGAFNGGRLLVYWNCNATTDGYPPRLLEITPAGAAVLKTYPDDTAVYSVDPERISEVMADFKALAPADDYGLIFWSHANGWLGSPSEAYNDRYRAFGDDRGHHITLPTLRRALEGERFSFIYFDCCLMGNVETIYEFRSLAPVIAAAPTELGIEGMPYDLTAPYFFRPVPDVAGAARETYGWYADRKRQCQLAVYDTSALPRLASASRSVLSSAPRYPQTITSLQRYVRPGEFCHSYDMAQYYDLLGAGPEWHQALDDVVMWCASTPQAIGSFDIDTYCGLGSHAPRSAADLTYRSYDALQWYLDVVAP